MPLQRTHIRYGDVDLVNCLTDRFSQEPVFDDSGTDMLYFKYIISVTCYVHGDTGAGTGANPGAGRVSGGPGANSPPTIYNASNSPAAVPGYGQPGAAYQSGAGYGTGPNGPFVAPGGQQAAVWTYRALRKQLSEERQQFQMWIGDNQILRSTPAWGSTEVNNYAVPIQTQTSQVAQHDLNNGPKVLSLDIQKVQGPHIFRVQWTVEICQKQCYDGAEAASKDEFGKPYAQHNTNHILSNRWSVVDDIDQDLMTTRTYTGVLRASTASVNPNVFRSYAVPTLGAGMKLHSMNFEVAADGLTLNYQIVHKEITHSAPYPATSWDFKWTITTGDGMISTADAHIRLKGHRKVSHGMLIQLGLQILESRLHWSSPAALNGDQDDVNNIIDHLSVTDRYGDSGSDVSLSCSVKLIGAAKALHHNVGGGGARPIPLPLQDAFDKMGIPILPSDLQGLFGVPSLNYDPDHSLGSRAGAWLGATGAAGTFVHGALGAPISGVLPLQQAFSCAMRDACLPATGNPAGRRGKWWINDVSGMGEAINPDYGLTNPSKADGNSGRSGIGQQELNYPIYHAEVVGGGATSQQDTGYTDEHKESMYTRHWSDSHYHTPDNLIPVPVAGALGGIGMFVTTASPLIGGALSFATNRAIRLTQPNTQWICRIIVERVGRRPQLPKLLKHFEDQSNPKITYSLINVSHNWQSPTIGADLAYATFRCDCEFTYSLSRPIEMEDDIVRQPDIPWLKTVGVKTVEGLRTGHKVKDSFTRQASSTDNGI